MEKKMMKKVQVHCRQSSELAHIDRVFYLNSTLKKTLNTIFDVTREN